VECPNWELSVVFKTEGAIEAELEARASEMAFYERPVKRVSGLDGAACA